MAIELNVSDIVAQLRATYGSAWREEPWDGLMSGSMDSPVTGIAVVWSPELTVLKRAIASGCNLVIAKDPVYWYEKEDKRPGADSSISRIAEGSAGGGSWDAIQKTKLYQQKKEFVESSKVNIYRISENWDGPNSLATQGLLKAMGWKSEEMIVGDPRFPNARTAIVSVPEQDLIHLAQDAKKRLGGKSARLVGERTAKVRKIAVHPGYLTIAAAAKIGLTKDLDVILTGETCEWEALVYNEDRISAGHGKGFLMLGLAVVSDAGAREVSAWVQKAVPSVKVEFMPVGDPFTPIYAGGLRS
jgi:putative NIF3 family GTP cyclohydrolase 1 type 2